MTASIARRYARALLEACPDGAKADQAVGELSRLRAALDESTDLRNVLFNPAFERAQRHALVDALAKPLSLGPLTQNLAHLLVDRSRFHFVGGIARAFQELADERAGRSRASVVSASPLPPELAPRLERALSAAVSRNVTVEARVDPSLLGGVVAQVGSLLFDGSVKTQLDGLRRELKQS
ncbi:MAG: ATP synthase F1 subunit delta [Deltaproteobacteria bacterium]